MKNIERKYIVDENNEKVAVQIDIKTFEKIEKALEDYVLGEKMVKNKKYERLEANEARNYYKKLKKQA